MPRGIAEVHVSAPLTNIAVKYQDPAFIAEQIFPVVPVAKEADKYYQFGKERLRRVDTLRAIGAKSREVDWAPTTAEYNCEEYALKEFLADRVVNNADVAVQPVINTVQHVTHLVRRDYESRVQALVQSTGTITQYATATSIGGAKWDAASGQDPQKDVDNAKTTIRRAIGVQPNTMLLSEPCAQALVRWLKSKNAVTYMEWLRESKLPPRLWELDLIIGSTVENTAMEGQAETIADIWGENVLVFYRHNGPPSLNMISLGFTIRQKNFTTKTWYDDEREGNYYQVSTIQTEKVVSASCGFLITDTMT